MGFTILKLMVLCGFKTIAATACIAILILLACNIFDHWNSLVGLWSDSISLACHFFSAGSSFWGGVSVALGAFITAVWLLCVCYHVTSQPEVSRRESKKITKLFAVPILGCAIIWLFAYLGVSTVYNNLTSISTYQSAAYTAIKVPLYLLYLLGFSVALSCISIAFRR